MKWFQTLPDLLTICPITLFASSKSSSMHTWAKLGYIASWPRTSISSCFLLVKICNTFLRSKHSFKLRRVHEHLGLGLKIQGVLTRFGLKFECFEWTTEFLKDTQNKNLKIRQIKKIKQYHYVFADFFSLWHPLHLHSIDRCNWKKNEALNLLKVSLVFAESCIVNTWRDWTKNLPSNCTVSIQLSYDKM